MDRTPAPRIVRCPSCGGDSRYEPGNPYRPFCSARCRNVDFGGWASESFRLAVKPTADDLDAGEGAPGNDARG